jgi:hypothetical protein
MSSPDRGEAADQLGQSRGPRDEPDVEVLAAVAPAADVHSADLADASDGALDPDDEGPQLGGQLVGQVRKVEMRSCLEDRDHRQPVLSLDWDDAPVLVTPQRRLVPTLASAAVDPALAVARLLLVDRWLQRPDADVALEWERLPLLQRRHPEPSVGTDGPLCAPVELLRRLAHRRSVPTSDSQGRAGPQSGCEPPGTTSRRVSWHV